MELPAPVVHKKAVMMPQGKKSRSIEVTQVLEWNEGKVTRLGDYLSAEEPLEMRAGRRSLGITLRTPGDDEELTCGFLFGEGIVSQPNDLRELRAAAHGGPKRNLIRVSLAPHIRGTLSGLGPTRRFSAGSACGVCGKASIAQLRRRGLRRIESSVSFDPQMLCAFPEKLRESQAVFGRTGGLHAAALFSCAGDLLVLREDIGRHNAVDKVIGWAFLQKRLPLSEHVLLVSGRGGFEIVQKAVAAGVSLLASVSAPSSLAVQLAREFGLTFVGFLRGRRFVVYSGEERLAASAAAPIAIE